MVYWKLKGSSAAALRKVSSVSWQKQQWLDLYVASFEAAYDTARAACPPASLDRLDVAWSYALALETSENFDQVGQSHVLKAWKR
jgi:hypothetical protein